MLLNLASKAVLSAPDGTLARGQLTWAIGLNWAKRCCHCNRRFLFGLSRQILCRRDPAQMFLVVGACPCVAPCMGIQRGSMSQLELTQAKFSGKRPLSNPGPGTEVCHGGTLKPRSPFKNAFLSGRHGGKSTPPPGRWWGVPTHNGSERQMCPSKMGWGGGFLF